MDDRHNLSDTMRPILLFFLIALSLRADVTLAPLFRDHAVLQHDKPLPVWGKADAGEHISVNFRGQTISTTADANGRWIVYLNAAPASTTPAELVITGNNTVRIADILVGEVWLCSGQSNMARTVSQAQNAATEIAAANFPLIRHFKVEQTVADAPATTTRGSWAVCTPATASDFTAVGFFFARDLQPRLGVPIGLINSSWNGTHIESWLSPAALASDPSFAVAGERWQQMLALYPAKKAEYDTTLAVWLAEEAEAKAKHLAFTKPRPSSPHGDSWKPACLFNGMINPLVPYALRGVLWYQGESNSENASEYRALFSALITHWRAHFGQGDFPFLWVQLADFKEPRDPTGVTFAYVREAQTQTLSLPATGQAITIDIGNPDDIHPLNKQEVGRRLALIARTKVYDSPVDCAGPVFAGATREGNALRVSFTQTGLGLTAGDKPLSSFEIAGADKKFFPATAKIDSDTLIVSAPEVSEPVAVRYAWRNAPDANLFSGAGLPAVPFRSDDW
jgi:sialate O-acetylesterase